jgi:hypothetical protein
MRRKKPTAPIADRHPHEGHRGAADQHEVRRAPEGHVLPEEPVPDVVEGEADQRERAARADEHSAQRRVPVAPELDRGRADSLLRQHHRDEAGAEDAEEADEDEVVGRVRERPLVAAHADVQRDVPVHPEHRDHERSGGDAGGQRGPARHAADALGEVGPAGEQAKPAGAVADAEREQHGRGDHGHSGGEHHLAHRGAAGGLVLGECERGGGHVRGRTPGSGKRNTKR